MQCVRQGLAASQCGEYEKAIAEYSEALGLLDPKDATAIVSVRCGRAIAWEKTGEHGKAKAD